uniref:VWFA domain-containing protein n=1 Tax=Plectus sambesii TaxID=2011161 RepID=A0A914XMP7_9BILA
MTTTTTTTTVSTPSASPTTPINPDCDLSQLLYDVALVFDVGEIATIDTNRLLNYAKNVALLFSANFTIGSKGGQFALLQYGDARGAWTWADFKTYGSHNALNSHINGSVRGSGQGPNDLDKAFEQIYEYFIAPGPEPGVRPNARHMVIFFSTQSPANLTAAISAAKTLRNATFCTVGIASGGVDISRVVGGANFATALNSPNDIPTVVQWLRHFVCTQPACPP